MNPREAWANPPVDDVGYISSRSMLSMGDDELRELVSNMEWARYTGWRNYENRWREVLGLDSTNEAVVLDYGCGVGVEALQYAKRGNKVYVADIVSLNVKLAQRVLKLYGLKGIPRTLRKSSSIAVPDEWLDVVHCVGVLHHIPDPVPVVEEFARILKPDGELRLMLYTDRAWDIATRTSGLPKDTKSHPEFQRFVRHWDAVGDYADWYNEKKINRMFGHCFEVKEYEYLTKSGEYVGVVMEKTT